MTRQEVLARFSPAELLRLRIAEDEAPWGAAAAAWRAVHHRLVAQYVNAADDGQRRRLFGALRRLEQRLLGAEHG